MRAFPYGIPTDFGKTGFGYRADLIPERPTSWHDLFSLAKKYPGKTTMIKYDSDVQGSFATGYLGYSIGNTKSMRPDAGDAERAAGAQTAPSGDPRDRLFQGADRGHGVDGDRLRLRHRGGAGTQQEHRLGAAERGHVRLPRGLGRAGRGPRTSAPTGT